MSGKIGVIKRLFPMRENSTIQQSRMERKTKYQQQIKHKALVLSGISFDLQSYWRALTETIMALE